MRIGSTCRVVLVVASAVLAGCGQEERVVQYKPFFAGLEGAKTGEPAVLGNGSSAAAPTDESDLIKTLPDGRKTVNARTVRQLILVIEQLLAEPDDELMFDQVISETTKQHLISQGRDPKAYVQYLHAQRREIARLFARMPLGEHSPTVIFEATDKNQFVVRLTGAAANGLYFTRIWVAMDRGRYRLVWIS
ncbi:MAG: hypothetical protein KF745_03490 [Phycisphaeraceae bacterium]|nr:hypothetical protein [Phycisphaeraceae bacterium]